ncbi:MAG: hypothetical protein ACO1SV_04445 [Fimbriimonas sp.]
MARRALFHSILIVLAVASGFAASRQPWQVLKEQEARTAVQVAEMRRSEAKREALVREEARYRSSLGREELARSRGLLPAGEHHADPQ